MMKPTSEERQYQRELGKLKQAWLRRLQREYQHLAGPFQPELKPASLGLMKGKRAWGRWNERERTILISEELIAGHPWSAVEGILGHEIIHQAVSELGDRTARQEPPHGPTFRKLGAQRGLHPFYLGASVDLSEACPSPLPGLNDERADDPALQVMEKVRKLLALSGSPVLAESQAAMNAAARLMARHNLDRLDEAPDNREYEYRTIDLESSRIQIRSTLIAGILGRHFFVQCIFTSGYDALNDKEIKCLELLGRPENTRLAEHVHHFLMERTESLWQEYYRHNRGGGLVARNSFVIGLLQAFDQKLNESAAAATDLSGGPGGFQDGFQEGFSALVLAKDQGLKEFFKRRYPNVVHKRSGRRRYNPEAGEAGEAAGRALNLNRPVERSSPQTETRLLGGKAER
jgi:SprT-like family./Protein of unknown function (DUF2786).